MARLILILLVFISQLTSGQTQSKQLLRGIGGPLTIGDKVPNLTIGYNIATNKKIKLYDIKASLILLDFFNTGCVGCIHDMKHLDSLQQNFSPRVKILSISDEQTQQLKTGVNRFKLLPSALTIIKEDSNFQKFFPRNGVPHHVWIDSSFHVRYITISTNATTQNFTSFLSGVQLPLVYKYELPGFDETQPLWLEGNGRLYDHLQYYSYIMKKIHGYNGSSLHHFASKANNTAGFTAVNQSLLSLIKAAWGRFPGQIFDNNNRIALEVKDSSVFLAPPDPNEFENWLEKNSYCYELRMPYSKDHEVFPNMQQDILRFFDYDIRIEKRKRLCLVLVRTSQLDKIKSKGFVKRQQNHNSDSIILNHSTLNNFVLSLNRYNTNLITPFLDETGYTDNVYMELGSSLTDINKLRLELNKYDLDLVEKNRMIEMLIISDKKESSN